MEKVKMFVDQSDFLFTFPLFPPLQLQLFYQSQPFLFEKKMKIQVRNLNSKYCILILLIGDV